MGAVWGRQFTMVDITRFPSPALRLQPAHRVAANGALATQAVVKAALENVESMNTDTIADARIWDEDELQVRVFVRSGTSGLEFRARGGKVMISPETPNGYGRGREAFEDEIQLLRTAVIDHLVVMRSNLPSDAELEANAAQWISSMGLEAASVVNTDSDAPETSLTETIRWYDEEIKRLERFLKQM